MSDAEEPKRGRKKYRELNRLKIAERRAAVAQKYKEGLTMERIAQALDCDAATAVVASRMVRITGPNAATRSGSVVAVSVVSTWSSFLGSIIALRSSRAIHPAAVPTQWVAPQAAGQPGERGPTRRESRRSGLLPCPQQLLHQQIPIQPLG